MMIKCTVENSALTLLVDALRWHKTDMVLQQRGAVTTQSQDASMKQQKRVNEAARMQVRLNAAK
jgi:hypothetical protein